MRSLIGSELLPEMGFLDRYLILLLRLVSKLLPLGTGVPALVKGRNIFCHLALLQWNTHVVVVIGEVVDGVVIWNSVAIIRMLDMSRTAGRHHLLSLSL